MFSDFFAAKNWRKYDFFKNKLKKGVAHICAHSGNPIKEKLRCDTLDIRIRNLLHKQDLCTIRKRNKKIPRMHSKKTSLMGHFLWYMRSRHKM
jgi:hypothetical protein